MTAPTPPRPEPQTEHPPRPTLEQIEAAVADEALRRQVEASAAAQPAPRPEPARTDWEATVLSIRDRSRPVRQGRERERSARQDRLDGARRRRVILATLDRLDRRFGRFVDATVEHPVVARWTLDAISGRRDGLVLRGPVGTGKTHLAVAAYRAVVAGGIVPAIAVAVPALLDGLRPGREPVEVLAACESARLLLLDDLAAERASDWTAETLYRLIDARYARRLPTIVTTNATAETIRANLGDRIASRLNGLGLIVTLDGPDRRTPRVD